MTSPVLAGPDCDYVFNNPKDCKLSLDEIYEKFLPLQSSECALPVAHLEEEGTSPVYANAAAKSHKWKLMAHLDTLAALWKNSVENFGGRPAFSSRPFDYHTGISEPYYVDTSYEEVDCKKVQFGSGLLFLLRNNPHKQQQIEAHRKIDLHLHKYRDYTVSDMSFIVTLFSGNRAEWVLADLACSAFAITNTVLYDTLGPGASEYILKLTQSPVVVCSYAHIERILKYKETQPKEFSMLIMVVSMDPLDCVSECEGDALKFRAKRAKIELFDMNQVCETGRLFPHQELPPNPQTAYTISFTLGTTGSAPKGVVLTHKNAAAAVCALACSAPHITAGSELSFLPLAHIYERQVLLFSLAKGGRCGFPKLEGNALTLIEDLRLFRPTHMANVPRVLTKMESAIKNVTLHLSLAIARALYLKIIEHKLQKQASSFSSKGEHWLYDSIFLPKLRRLLGFDNMQCVFTALAPISPQTVKFMKAALGIGLAQGYGLTELFGAFCLSESYEVLPGSCGPPGICSSVRVREIPSLGYTLADPRGPSGELEICGAQIFSHYYKNGEETENALSLGWLRSGDVARIDCKTGRIYIIDRVKSFLKLAQGEYVSPEKVENVYLLANPLLTQCFVHGDSMQHFLVAVVGVDPIKVRDFVREKCHNKNLENSRDLTDLEILEIVNRPQNRSRLLRELNANVSGLHGFELIQNLYVEYEPLRLDREVVTPTVKIRRPIAARFFREQIETMYLESSLLGKSKL